MWKCENALRVGQTPGGNRFVQAECAQAARDLAASHLAGPTASAALAEGLVAAALLSADLGTPEEAVTLHIQCDGPLGSLLVEATYEGTLSGYTAKKILNDLDGHCAHQGRPDGPALQAGQRGTGAAEAPALATATAAALGKAFGATGMATVMASLPGKVLAQSSIRIMQTPRPERALAAYYAEGAQRDVKVAIDVVLDAEGRVATARGALIERMPGSDAAEFTLLNATPGSDGQAAPGQCVAPTARPLRFACRCSREKALATLAALPADERRELAAKGAPIDIYCHMCGKCHTIKPNELEELAGRM